MLSILEGIIVIILVAAVAFVYFYLLAVVIDWLIFRK